MLSSLNSVGQPITSFLFSPQLEGRRVLNMDLCPVVGRPAVPTLYYVYVFLQNIKIPHHLPGISPGPHHAPIPRGGGHGPALRAWDRTTCPGRHVPAAGPDPIHDYVHDWIGQKHIIPITTTMPSIAIRRNHKKKVSWWCDRNINIHPHEIKAR